MKEKIRKRLSEEEAKYLGLEPKKSDGYSKNAKYVITQEQLKSVNEYRNGNVFNVSRRTTLYDSDGGVRMQWVRTDKAVEDLNNSIKKIEERFEETVDNLVEKVKKVDVNPKKVENSGLFDILVFTDVHIGMEPNANGYSLYGGKWDEEELEYRSNIMISKTIANQQANELIIFDLGDLMDGWDSKTVRREHDLPQNMDNEKAFDVGLSFKVNIIANLANYYNSITIVNITDDNHSGSFSYVVNSAFARLMGVMYDNVKVINQRKFIDHIILHNKVFISTHGKDGKNLKFGFKPKLDPIQMEKIENYLYENGLMDKKYEIFFLKGDSHQDLLDNSSSQKFKYWNFPAFSPASNWVMTNFKLGFSGFYTFNFRKDSYSQHPYYF